MEFRELYEFVKVHRALFPIHLHGLVFSHSHGFIVHSNCSFRFIQAGIFNEWIFWVLRGVGG